MQDNPKVMKKNLAKIVIALVVVLGAGGFIAFNLINAGGLAAADGGNRNAIAVTWENPSIQTITTVVNARGTVELVNSTAVFPETQAQIRTIAVNIGDEVQVGDLLITYDDSILETFEDQLIEANLALRSAQLGLASAQLAPLPSDTEILSAENQIDQARTNITTIEAELNHIDLQISQAEQQMELQLAQIEQNSTLQISQIEENLRQAQATRDNVQTLFNAGVSTRVELDNAENSVRNLEDQLNTARRNMTDQLDNTRRNFEDQLNLTRSQRNTATLRLAPAEEAVRLAQAQLSAIQGRTAQPQALNNAQIQQVQIEQAQFRISQIERNIADFAHEERSQVAGTVLSVFMQEGEFSTTARPMFEIADISSDNLVVIVHVPENNAGNLEVGQEVEISGGALGTTVYDGFISVIRPVATRQQIGTTVETAVTVEIIVPNADRLRAGFTIDADIVTNVNEDTMVVPLMSTLSETGGVNYVFVINDNNTLERRDIVIGGFSDMYVEVFGLTFADRIVSNPTMQMFDGMPVRPIAANPLLTN